MRKEPTRDHLIVFLGLQGFRVEGVASTACRLQGREADAFKAVFWHSLVLASLVGLLVLVFGYIMPWVIPG
jgi:hypothetical protein